MHGGANTAALIRWLSGLHLLLIAWICTMQEVEDRVTHLELPKAVEAFGKDVDKGFETNPLASATENMQKMVDPSVSVSSFPGVVSGYCMSTSRLAEHHVSPVFKNSGMLQVSTFH